MSLRAAATLIRESAADALRAGDKECHDRLSILADRVAGEGEYLTNCADGTPRVTTRPYPPGSTIGWIFANCAATQAKRAALGLTNSDLRNDRTTSQ